MIITFLAHFFSNGAVFVLPFCHCAFLWYVSSYHTLMQMSKKFMIMLNTDRIKDCLNNKLWKIIIPFHNCYNQTVFLLCEFSCVWLNGTNITTLNSEIQLFGLNVNSIFSISDLKVTNSQVGHLCCCSFILDFLFPLLILGTFITKKLLRSVTYVWILKLKWIITSLSDIVFSMT